MLVPPFRSQVRAITLHIFFVFTEAILPMCRFMCGRTSSKIYTYIYAISLCIVGHLRLEQNTLHNLNKNSRLIFSISRNYVASASYYTLGISHSTPLSHRTTQLYAFVHILMRVVISMPMKLSETMSKIIFTFFSLFQLWNSQVITMKKWLTPY